jgi:hypothetical protein
VAERFGEHKENDKTVIEQVKPQRGRFKKRLKQGTTLFLLAVLATISFSAWTIYSEELTYRDLRKLTKEKAVDISASAFDKLLKKSKEISVSAFDQFMTIAKRKIEDFSEASSEQNITVRDEKGEEIPVSHSGQNSITPRTAKSSKLLTK